MTTLQFKVKLNIISQDEHSGQADIALYAKNMATLEEYVHRSQNFNATYLNKLQKWIAKKKYTITPMQAAPGADGEVQQIHLQIEIFSFYLLKIHRNDMDVLKDEFRALKSADVQLQREILLNNYQFFSHANDSQLKRKLVENLNPGQSGIKREAIVDNIEHGFDRIECQGWTQGSGSDERFFLLLREPLSYELGGKARQLEGLINALNLENDSTGKTSSMKIVNVVKTGVQQVTVPDRNSGGQMSQTFFAYEVDRPVRAQGEYELLISKVNRVM